MSPCGVGCFGYNEDGIDDMDEFDCFLSQKYGSDRSKSQLESYLEESSLNRKMHLDVLSYWKTNRTRYTVLSVMARDILSIPITTVALESSLSIGGHIITKYRISITPENAEALLCTQNWLYGSDDEEEEELVIHIETIVIGLDTMESRMED